ncbi:glycosyltransferase family 9 protein [Pseudomonadota bacterium]
MNLWFKSGAWASKKGRQVAAQLAPEDVKSVAVIRHAAVGDMVLTRPFLIELRCYFPNAKITLSLSSNYTRGAPLDLVDCVHEVYGNDRRDVTLKEQITRAKELGHHDLVFDLAATSRSFWLCLLTSAKLKIGFPYHSLQKYIYYDIAIPRSDLQFEAENMLGMLNALGHATQYPPVFDMPVKAAKRDRPYMVYFSSASTKEKCWPDESFAELVKQMSERYPKHEHIVLEGIADWESIDDIMSAQNGKENVVGLRLDDFDETVSLVKGASLLVGNCTGIRNIALACETPTVGIFFMTPVFRYWPRYHHHEAAFTPDGKVPSVEQVFGKCRKVVDAVAREKAISA